MLFEGSFDTHMTHLGIAMEVVTLIPCLFPTVHTGVNIEITLFTNVGNIS